MCFQDTGKSSVGSEVAGEEAAVHLRARAVRHDAAGTQTRRIILLAS
jgi:hypothetical protein